MMISPATTPHSSAWLAKIQQALSRVPEITVTGYVLRVVGLIVEAHLPEVPIGASCQILRSEEETPLMAEVIGVKGQTAILMPIGATQGIRMGDRVCVLGEEVGVKVSPHLLGRVLDGSGHVMDDGPGFTEMDDVEEYPLYHPTASPMKRRLIDTPLSLGIRAIDGFLTLGEGQRMAIMAGSGVGKSTLMGMMARYSQADVNVIGLIGERGREVREFLEDSLGAEGLKRSVVVIATSDTPALLRMRAAFIATTIAEYFRDRGKKVLLMMDSLTRFAMASREVGLSLGEPPTVRGYTPTLFATLPKLLERAGNGDGAGSITGLYTILTEGDDIQDPVADTVRSIVDGHIVLSRAMANMGHYPPIDLLQSLSRIFNQVTKSEHREAMTQVRRYIAIYEDMKDYIKMGVYTTGKNAELDRAIQKMEEIKKFLQQEVADNSPWPSTIKRLQELAS